MQRIAFQAPPTCWRIVSLSSFCWWSCNIAYWGPFWRPKLKSISHWSTVCNSEPFPWRSFVMAQNVFTTGSVMDLELLAEFVKRSSLPAPNWFWFGRDFPFELQ